MDEEEEAVNGIQDILVSYVKKERHSLVDTCYITLW